MKSFHDKFICILSLSMCILISILLISGKQNDFSEEENRALQTIKAEQIFTGDIFSLLNSFCSDQFPQRKAFLLLSSLTNQALDMTEINGTIIANDGYLISRHDYTDLTVLERNISSVKSFLEDISSKQIQAKFMIAPRTVDVMASKLPSQFPKSYGSYEYEIIKQNIKETELISPLDYLKRCAENGEYVYYRTDHHWTTDGAYRAYEMLAENSGISAYQKEYFDIQCVSKNFYGTSYSKALLQDANPDEIYLYRYDSDENISVIYQNRSLSKSSFYDLSVISKDQKDKYKVFLSGNTDLLLIRNENIELPRLLLIKDSFANSIIPFLSLHYDIDVIDLRYYKSSVSDYISENNFDAVLLLYGVDTLCTDISCSNILK